MNDNQLNEISKFLSYILRHEPHTIGLQLDTDGWADVDALVSGAASKGYVIDHQIINCIIASSDKKRFALSCDGKKIRASQGHSTTDVNIAYAERVPADILYHGTASRFLESILREGLVPGSRHHVHLSEDIQTAEAVGKRYGKPVILKVESLRMHQQGYKFFQAQNGVWLTDHVPVSFIRTD